MRIGSFLWLLLGVSLLGWYGFAMVGIGLVLWLIGAYLKCLYDDYKYDKWLKEHEK